MRWVPANESKPTSYRCVLVQLAPGPGHAASVAVGYWKFKGEREANYWVVPGARGGYVLTHWCDCLGDDFEAPSWPGTRRGGPMSNLVNRATS